MYKEGRFHEKEEFKRKACDGVCACFSLVLGEASAVVAAPADASATCATETVAEQAPEAKTAEEAVALEAETAEEAVAPESVETEVQIPETEDAEDAAPEAGSVAEAEETSVSEMIQRSQFRKMMRIWMQMRHMMEAFQK